MALRSLFRIIGLLLLLVPSTGARYLIEGASITSPGLMPLDGMSPRPTLAAEWNRVPHELRRRADSIIPSSLSNLCGFLDGDPGESEIKYSLLSLSLEFENCFVQNLIYRPTQDHRFACGSATSCIFYSGYATCCTNLNTASCFTNTATKCLDSSLERISGIGTHSTAW